MASANKVVLCVQGTGSVISDERNSQRWRVLARCDEGVRFDDGAADGGPNEVSA